LLDAEEQVRLFIPFFRASNSVQKKGLVWGYKYHSAYCSLHKGSITYSVYNNMNRFTLVYSYK
jgi:hypothetical protein